MISSATMMDATNKDQCVRDLIMCLNGGAISPADPPVQFSLSLNNTYPLLFILII